jgi:DUF4097 and DUF4098 domain-containing protein YvlB
MTTWEFPCSEPATISIGSWQSGSVAVSGEDTDTIYVEVVPSQRGADADDLLAGVRVSFANGRLSVTGPRFGSFRRRKGLDLTIKAPAGSDCEAHAASADVSCVGRLGTLTVHTASGDVTAVATTGRVAVQTASGDVFVDQADSDVRISSASGDVQVAQASGEVRASTVSGDLAIGDCGGPLVAQTTSGDIEVKELSAGRAELSSISGNLHVSVTPGIGVYLELASTSGNVRSDLDEDFGDDTGAPPRAALEIKCRTLSGDIRIAKAAAGASPQHSASA